LDLSPLTRATSFAFLLCLKPGKIAPCANPPNPITAYPTGLKVAINLLYWTQNEGRIVPDFGCAVKPVCVQAKTDAVSG
jgi:hypothetical protein